MKVLNGLSKRLKVMETRQASPVPIVRQPSARTLCSWMGMAREILRGINWRAYGLIGVLILIWLGFNILTGGLFLSPRNISLLLRAASITALAATGVVMVIVMGHIDLSIGSAVGLCAILAAALLRWQNWPTFPVIIATILAGLVLGIWQGFWVAVMRVPAFVVTLGGLLIFRGIGLVITEGNTIASFPPDFQEIGQGFIPPLYSWMILAAFFVVYVLSRWRARQSRLAHGFDVAPVARLVVQLAGVGLLVTLFGLSVNAYQGFPVPVAIVGVMALLFSFVMRRTAFGRRLYALGGNLQAARLAGVRVELNTFIVFCLVGAVYGLNGLIFASRLNGAPPTGALFLELDAIAAAVIGGTSLMGGVGTVAGALLGALLMASVQNGLSLMNVPTFYQLIVSGLILIGAVYLDIYTKRERS